MVFWADSTKKSLQERAQVPVLYELCHGTLCKLPQLLVIPELHHLSPSLGQGGIWEKIWKFFFFKFCRKPVQLAYNEVRYQPCPGEFTL